jgi:hypothetical protein
MLAYSLSSPSIGDAAVVISHERTHIRIRTHMQVGIESVVLEHVVLPGDVPNTVHVPVAEGVYVTGLTLMGAHWDSVSQALSQHIDTHMYAAFPPLQLRPRVRATDDCKQDGGDGDGEGHLSLEALLEGLTPALQGHGDVAPVSRQSREDGHHGDHEAGAGWRDGESDDADGTHRDASHVLGAVGAAGHSPGSRSDAASRPRKLTIIDTHTRLVTADDAGAAVRQTYTCPIYRTARRADCAHALPSASTNLVMEVLVPCAPPGAPKGAALLFIKRATALLIEAP